MPFFDELSKTLSDKGKEAARKARELTETLQLKTQINTEKNVIQDAYTLIGKLYFEEQGIAPDEKYREPFERIQEALDRIAALEDEIHEREGVRVCPSCGAKVEKDCAYCKHCGSKMPDKVVPAEESAEDAVDVESTVVEPEPSEAGEVYEEAEAAGKACQEADEEKSEA